MEKIKDNGVQRAMLDIIHIVMYMPIEPDETIETFMINGKIMVIESFTQHLSSDSCTMYFWTYCFQLGS